MPYALSRGGKSCLVETGGPSPGIVLSVEGSRIAEFPLSSLFVFSDSRPWALRGADLGSLSAELDGDRLVLFASKVFHGLSLRAVLSWAGNALSLEVRWTNEGPAFSDAVVGIAFPLSCGAEAKCTLPHVIYNDNPSADPDSVIPRIGKIAGKGVVCEEHRLPIPGLNVQWSRDGAFPDLSVLSVPSLLDAGDIDSCWSAGILKSPDGYDGLFLSGAAMFNGEKDVIYGGQCSPVPYGRGYFAFASGAVVEKRLYISWGNGQPDGQGFRSLVRDAWALFKPRTVPAMDRGRLADLKFNCLDSRFREDGASAGYSCFGAANDFGNISKRPEYYLYAWTGEALKLAWCDARRAIDRGEPERLARASRTVDFFVRSSLRTPSGFPSAYFLYEEDRWGGAWFDNDRELSSRMVGCSVSDLLDYMSLLSGAGQPIPAEWESFVRSVCSSLLRPDSLTADGVFPLKWRVDGTPSEPIFTSAGIPCVIALSKAGRRFSEPGLIRAAEAIFSVYYDFTARTMRFPFAFATLDAKCEDKEAGMYFLSAAVELYRATSDAKYLDWARIAADWVMTFQYLWEPPVRAESLCTEYGFRIVGWPGVSPQNHHLDVFFPAADLIELGRLTGEDLYAAAGRLVLDAWTHGVCVEPGDYGFTVPGEQGEQYHHTNYVQCRLPEVLGRTGEWRGGMQRWNPSWIIAEVLQAVLTCPEE